MFANKGNSKIIAIVAVFLILAFSWFAFSKPKTQDDELVRYSDGVKMSEIEKDMINTLSTVGRIEINGDIFKNRAFHVLQDRTRRITEEPVGRANPFAPVDFAEISSSQTVDSNQDQNVNYQNTQTRELTPREQ